MEDILFALLWIFLFFGLPELLRRRRRPQEYEYPDIPDDAQIEMERGAAADQPFIQPPPLPEKTYLPLPEARQTAQPVIAAQPLSPELRSGMLWHVVLSPPVSMQRGRQRQNRVGQGR